MATFTICYSGTDCYLDHALVLRKPREMASYNVESRYIPSKIHDLLSKYCSDQGIAPLSTTLNGCGGPYNETCEELPIRIWSEVTEEVDSETHATVTNWKCSKAPRNLISASDTVSGNSVEWIAIAGIAQMFGVTLHLVEAGRYQELIDEWPSNPSFTMDYRPSDLAYPLNNQRWNLSPQSEAGHYCLRWSKEDDDKIQSSLNGEIDTVALVGHSRGGVACIIASNYLAEWFPSLAIKIVAFDPVPGTGDWWGCLTRIPAMSQMEYVGIYAIDETSAGFNAVAPQVKGIDATSSDPNSPETKIWDPLSPKSDPSGFKNWSVASYQLIYTRGRHATVPGSKSLSGGAKVENDSDPQIGSSGNLAFALTIKLLNKWKVPLVELRGDKVQEWIASMNGSSALFEKMRDYNYTGLGFLNNIVYYKARGISSTGGSEFGKWQYLEAFITPPEVSSQTQSAINWQRGLIAQCNWGITTWVLRDQYYPSLGGTGRVHRWTYLGDYLQNYAQQNRIPMN